MHVSIRDFRRVEAAAIDINTVTVVAGLNGQGKSSIAQAVGTLLTRNSGVLDVAKKDMGSILRDGSQKAVASLHGAAGDLVIEWPSCAVKEEGEAPRATPIAAGLTRFTALSSKDAARVLISALEAVPTHEEMKEAFFHLTTPENFEEIVRQIADKGWDATAASILDGTKTLKGRWQEVTREAWGSKKGETWQPAEMQGDIIKIQESDLLEELSDAQTQYEHAIATKAVDEERRKILEAEAAQLDGLRGDLASLDQEITKQETVVSEAQKLVDDYRASAQSGETFPCPHCRETVERKPIAGGFQYIAATQEEGGKDIKVERIAHARNCGALENQKTKLATYQNDRRQLVLRIDMVEKAEKEFAEIKGGTTDSPSTAESAHGMFKKAVETATVKLEAYRRWRRAQEIHLRIVRGLALADEVHPEGLRRRKLISKIEGFNRNLMQMSQSFAIEPVNIDVDMNVYAGRRPYKFLSASMQYRVDVVIQAAIAKIDGSAAIVVDGADIIVGADRAGLITMLLGLGIPSLVCVSLTKPENVPSVWQHGGAAYWIENSTTKRLGA